MKSMTIGKKLFLSFGAALVLTLGVSVVALLGIGNLGASLDKVIKVNAMKRYLAADIGTVMSDLTAEERGILARAYMKDKATVEQYNGDFRASEAKFKKDVEEFTPLIETAEARRAIQSLDTDVGTISQNHDELYRAADSGQLDAASAVLKDKVMPLILKSKATSDQLSQQENDLMATASKSAEGLAAQSRWITIVMIALSLLVAVVVVYIVRQINSSLRQAVGELAEGAEQTASAASQVSASSQSLAQGASEQAASLEETSASTEEINSMARKNTENTRSAADLVSQSQQKFVQTNQSLEEMVVAMGEIKTSSDKISKIIKTIDEIAFQTNILALNAAVEAARAGEAGMGFAVVADEVRNLAQRCAQAAKDTAALIEESISRSNDGKNKVDQVAVAIRAITEDSGKVQTLVDEVNLGSQEQARGIDQIGKAVAQMEEVTQKTAANAEESAAAAEELNAQSATLKDIVERLSAMVGGDESAGTRRGVVRKRIAAGHHGAAPQRHGDSAASLSALHAAVAHKIGGHAAESVPVSAKADRSALPLEEEFKEF